MSIATPGGDSASTRERILDAADEFLREHPFRELTVSELMQRTNVSRPAFYQYFRDRYDIVEGLIGRVAAATQQIADSWNPPGVVACDRTIRQLCDAIAPYGYAIKAISDASCADSHIEQMWRGGFLAFYISDGVRFIGAEQARGAIPAELDPELTARMLVMVTVSLVVDCLADPNVTPDDTRRVGDTAARMWCSTLYPGESV